MSEPPRFWYKESSGRLYFDKYDREFVTISAYNKQQKVTWYLIGSQLTRQMAERIAAMLGGTLEVE